MAGKQNKKVREEGARDDENIKREEIKASAQAGDGGGEPGGRPEDRSITDRTAAVTLEQVNGQEPNFPPTPCFSLHHHSLPRSLLCSFSQFSFSDTAHLSVVYHRTIFLLRLEVLTCTEINRNIPLRGITGKYKPIDCLDALWISQCTSGGNKEEIKV